MERQTFTILFFVKKSLKLKNGESPILCRITVDGIEKEIRVQRSVLAENWNQSSQRCTLKGRAGQELNDYLDTVRIKLMEIHRKLELDGTEISSQLIKDLYQGKKAKPKMLIEEYNEFNKNIRELIGKGYSKDTVKRYERNARYLVEFMERKYGFSDIPFKKIDREFIVNYIHFLKTVKGCEHNGLVKPLKNFRKIYKEAVLNRWVDGRDPFEGIDMNEEPTDPDFLMKHELDKLINKNITIKKLAKIKDIFVFCCFTGLSYTDVYTLREEHIIKDNNEQLWIKKKREKTGVISIVPLMDIPLTILKKYETDVDCLVEGKLLPVVDIHQANIELKAIARICGIDKELSTHVARHTFATMAMTFGASMESISKMLGHASIDLTKLYARILDEKIIKEIDGFKLKFHNIDYNALQRQ